MKLLLGAVEQQRILASNSVTFGYPVQGGEKVAIIRPLPLREAAKEIGVSAATLSRVLRGGTMDVSTFYAICKWLKFTPLQAWVALKECVESGEVNTL